jgi:hypothetical protein
MKLTIPLHLLPRFRIGSALAVTHPPIHLQGKVLKSVHYYGITDYLFIYCYIVMRSHAQTTQHRTTVCSVKYELERVWKEVTMT